MGTVIMKCLELPLGTVSQYDRSVTFQDSRIQLLESLASWEQSVWDLEQFIVYLQRIILLMGRTDLEYDRL
ncbi:hypothetical protein WG66_008377 [Moniliophthora roreri]|nr:hypothetical protein WG66_008377 [Moniliophthora roreri]